MFKPGSPFCLNNVRSLLHRVASAALGAACLLSATDSVRAYARLNGNPQWNQPTLPVVLQFPAPPFVLTDGSVNYYNSFENALSLWNEQMRDFQFTWTEEAPGATQFSDGNRRTEVSMQAKIYNRDFDSGTLAVTLLNYQNGRMVEADVIFNVSSRKFDSYRGFKGLGEDFHRVALHELGHVLGLDHPDEATPKQSVASIMNANVSGIDHLLTDDIQGAQAIYGAAPNAPAASAGNGRVANISTRVRVGTGGSVMIGGFIIQEATKPVLIRALGPSLAGFVNGPLPDPTLELHNGNGDTITANNNWKDNPAQAQAIAATGIAPKNDLESAIYANLPAGAYTAVVSGTNGTSGVGLVEVYDLAQPTGKIGNIATRAQVGAGDDVLIGGFIVGGPQAVRVIVRAIGPSLSAFLPDYLRDPTLELRNGNGELLQANDDWDQTNYALADSGLAPKNGLESAVLAYLAPGNFTAIVRGKNNSTGIGLVEIYDVPPEG